VRWQRHARCASTRSDASGTRLHSQRTSQRPSFNSHTGETPASKHYSSPLTAPSPRQLHGAAFTKAAPLLYSYSKFKVLLSFLSMSHAMMHKIGPLLLIVSLWLTVPAQTTKRSGATRKPAVNTPQPQPAAQPQPAPSTQPARPPAAPVPLVVVNGQTFTTADL